MTARAGLTFAEIIVTSDTKPRIVDVAARVRYHLFGPGAQRAIADALADPPVRADLPLRHPSPGFPLFERATNQPISPAIAQLLAATTLS